MTTITQMILPDEAQVRSILYMSSLQGVFAASTSIGTHGKLITSPVAWATRPAVAHQGGLSISNSGVAPAPRQIQYEAWLLTAQSQNGQENSGL